MNVFAPVTELSDEEEVETRAVPTPKPKPESKAKGKPKGKPKAEPKPKVSVKPKAKPSPSPVEPEASAEGSDAVMKKPAAAKEKKTPEKKTAEKKTPEKKTPPASSPMKRPAAASPSAGESGEKKGKTMKVSAVYQYKATGKFACKRNEKQIFQVGGLKYRDQDKCREIAVIARDYLLEGKSDEFVKDVVETLEAELVLLNAAGGPDGTFNAPPSSEQPEIVETDETVEVEQPAAEGGEEELKEEDPEIPVPPSLDLDAEILAARGGKGPVARPRPEDID
ncbi:unnamed protein product [Durusdinium trenchii]|uniref:Uncharacterized protein n=1 Tax=Durusdinium trenchii TaxID=1381693 RepID=A0ABP0PHQ6_9DINO